MTARRSGWACQSQHQSGQRTATRDGKQGQALVEAALTFPLLVVVALALLQFALFAHAQNVVTGSVQDGARIAAAENRSVGEGVAYTQSLLQAGLGATAANVQVQGRDAGTLVVIEAHGQFPLLIPGLPGSLPLEARAMMAKEGFQAGPGR